MKPVLKKKKGMTLIELIIAMTIMVIILIAAYSFFTINNTSLSLVDMQNTLQMESKDIQDRILQAGTQASQGIEVENTSGINIIDYSIDSMGLDSNDQADVKEVSFKSYDDKITTIRVDDKDFYIDTDSTNSSFSSHVESMKLKPLNINQLSDDDKSKLKVVDLEGYELTINLRFKKGKNDTSLPVTVNVKFRNMQDVESTVRSEAKNVENKLSNSIQIAKSIKSIMNSSGSNLADKTLSEAGLKPNQTIDVGGIILNNPDGTETKIKINDNELSIKKGNDSENIITDKVSKFKLSAVYKDDDKDTSKKLSDVDAIEFIITLKDKQGGQEVEYPFSYVIKFTK